VNNFIKDSIARAVIREWMVASRDKLDAVLEACVEEMAKVGVRECEDELRQHFAKPEIIRVMDIMFCTLQQNANLLQSIWNSIQKGEVSQELFPFLSNNIIRIEQATQDYLNLEKLLAAKGEGYASLTPEQGGNPW